MLGATEEISVALRAGAESSSMTRAVERRAAEQLTLKV